MKNLLFYLENRKSEIEKEISKLDLEKRNLSRKISEIQAMIIGLNGELNAINDTIKKMIEELKT